MASNKEFKTRIQHKIDTPENWAKATNFIPLNGEIIVYSYPAEDGLQSKIKIGDGSSYLANLPFINTEITLNGTSKAATTASFYAPTASGTDGYILQAKGEKVAPVWVDPSDLLSGDFLPVDELTDSYAKVRPLLLSADNGEVSLTPSGIEVENSDGDVITINSTGVSATNSQSEDYAILNTQGVSAYSSSGEIYTSLNGINGLSLQGGEKTINLNYNGLNIDTDDLSLGLESTNGLTFSNYLTGKSIILSPEKLVLDRGNSNTTIDEQKFQLTRDSGEQTTLTSTSLQLKMPKPLENGETTRTYSTFTINGDATNSTYTINTSNFSIRSEKTINLQGEKIFLNSPTEISIEPKSDNSIVNKKYVDEKIGKPSENVIIYQDDGTNSGNYNPAIGTLIVGNEIEADLLEDGSLVYDVVFTQDEEGIPASAIDFTPNGYVNENNVQSAIENLQTKVASAHNGLSSLSTTVNTHTTNINALDNTVASHTTSIGTINTTINSHTSTINSHTTSINNLQTAMNNLVTDVWHIGSTPPSNVKLFWIDTNTTTGGLKYLPSGSTNSAANWKHVPVAWT